MGNYRMVEKPFTDDEIFNACALIIERKAYRLSPETIVKNERRNRKTILNIVLASSVLTIFSIILENPFVTVIIIMFSLIALSLLCKDSILSFNENNPFPERRKMMQIYRELNNQYETDKEVFARAYLVKAKAEYDAKIDARRREIFETGRK